MRHGGCRRVFNETEDLDIAEQIITSVSYGDSTASGWPALGDGDGYTLVLKRPTFAGTNPSLGSSWRPSGALNGAPGAVDSTAFAGSPLADIDLDSFNALAEYGLGTSATSGASKPQLTTSRDGGGRMVLSFVRPAAADDVAVEVLESTDLSAWQLAVPMGETVEGPGLIRATWRSNATGPAVYLRVRVSLP